MTGIDNIVDLMKEIVTEDLYVAVIDSLEPKHAYLCELATDLGALLTEVQNECVTFNRKYASQNLEMQLVSYPVDDLLNNIHTDCDIYEVDKPCSYRRFVLSADDALGTSSNYQELDQAECICSDVTVIVIGELRLMMEVNNG